MKTNGEEPFEFLSFGLLAVNAQIDGISNINPRNLRGNIRSVMLRKEVLPFLCEDLEFCYSTPIQLFPDDFFW